MASFTLDDIKSAADKKYGHTEIELGDEKVVMRNPLRLSKAERDELKAVQNADDEGADSSVDEGEKFDNIFRIVIKDKQSAQRLIDATEGDLAIKATIMEKYSSETQVGEASPSQS